MQKNTCKIILQINKNDDKQVIFDIFAKELNFPKYFGNNWDAFWDCITDFSWLKCKIIIIHISGESKDQELKNKLINILKEAQLYWNKQGGIKLEVNVK